MFTFQERSPPILDDFLYICDDAYNRPEMLRTEIDVLKTIDFDLGIPLSYRFLRRYAKVLHWLVLKVVSYTAGTFHKYPQWKQQVTCDCLLSFL